MRMCMCVFVCAVERSKISLHKESAKSKKQSLKSLQEMGFNFNIDLKKHTHENNLVLLIAVEEVCTSDPSWENDDCLKGVRKVYLWLFWLEQSKEQDRYENLPYVAGQKKKW